MKKLIISCLSVFLTTLAFSQTVTVSGNVTDQKGNPVPFAFVYDAQHPYATYADPSGAFILKADPASSLTVKALKFLKTTVKISNPSDVKVVLSEDPAANTPGYITNNGNPFGQSKDLVNFNTTTDNRMGATQEEVHGSRFLFANGLHGFVIDPGGSIRQNDDNLFDYDKLDGNMMLTADGKNTSILNKGEIKVITLYDNSGMPHAFEVAPDINKDRFAEVIAQGSKFKIYKEITTKYIKANFTTNGMTSSGNKYDEFQDDSAYYAIKIPGGQPQKFALKKKAIKAAFGNDPAVLKYLSENDGDIDDKYLRSLGEFTNQ